MITTQQIDLPDHLFYWLQQEQYALLVTLDAERNTPCVSAISWIFAPNKKHIRLAVGSHSRIVKNIQYNPEIVISLIGPNSTYEISGIARIQKDYIQTVKIHLSQIEVEVTAVRDVMFYGAKITKEPSYQKEVTAKPFEDLDEQVMRALSS